MKKLREKRYKTRIRERDQEDKFYVTHYELKKKKKKEFYKRKLKNTADIGKNERRINRN